MTTAADWSEEIRAYLLGRIHRPHDNALLPRPVLADMAPAPIRGWWLFEGKRYGVLAGPMRSQWPEIRRLAHAMLRSFTPSWRVSEYPDGAIDWGRTLSHVGHLGRDQYVVHSSRIGIDEKERDVIVGWARWISGEWRTYCGRFEFEEDPDPLRDLVGTSTEVPLDLAQLRRWAQIARRSRWPLLREVIAETLRVLFDPQDVDQVPLPSERHVIFELLCLVRIARALEPRPTDLRWIDNKLTKNEVQLPDCVASFQETLGRNSVLTSTEYSGDLADAVEVFDVVVPDRMDVTFRFRKPRRGVRGIILEAKSGKQSTADAVHQLRTYRACAGRDTAADRWLVWGVAEQAPQLTEAQDRWLGRQVARGSGDIWAFTNAEDIPRVMTTLFELLSPIASS